MKRKKLIIAIVGVTVLFTAVCSGLILAQGILAGAVLHPSTARERRPIQAWELEKTKLDEFSDLSVSLSYCDLFLLPGDDFYLEYRMDGTCEEPEYNVSEGTFTFREGQTSPRYRSNFHFFFNPGVFYQNSEPYYVNLYLPEEQYFNLMELSSESGSIEIGSLQAKNMDIHAEYGNFYADSLTGQDIEISMESGNIELKTLACDNLKLTNDYGDISADSLEISNAASVTLESGNLTLSRLSSAKLSLCNEYGNCRIDETEIERGDITIESGNLNLYGASLGKTEINNSYGNISLELSGKITDYNYNLDASYGELRLDGKDISPNEDGEVFYRKDNGQEDELHIQCESGNIEIR